MSPPNYQYTSRNTVSALSLPFTHCVKCTFNTPYVYEFIENSCNKIRGLNVIQACTRVLESLIYTVTYLLHKVINCQMFDFQNIYPDLYTYYAILSSLRYDQSRISIVYVLCISNRFYSLVCSKDAENYSNY